jgi:hypothetical protein
VPSLTGRKPASIDLLEWSIFQPDFGAMNEQLLRGTIAPALMSLQPYRGHARARVRFGALSLVNYMKPTGDTYTLEEFGTLMANPQTVAEVIRT